MPGHREVNSMRHNRLEGSLDGEQVELREQLEMENLQVQLAQIDGRISNLNRHKKIKELEMNKELQKEENTANKEIIEIGAYYGKMMNDIQNKMAQPGRNEVIEMVERLNEKTQERNDKLQERRNKSRGRKDVIQQRHKPEIDRINGLIQRREINRQRVVNRIEYYPGS